MAGTGTDRRAGTDAPGKRKGEEGATSTDQPV